MRATVLMAVAVLAGLVVSSSFSAASASAADGAQPIEVGRVVVIDFARSDGTEERAPGAAAAARDAVARALDVMVPVEPSRNVVLALEAEGLERTPELAEKLFRSPKPMAGVLRRLGASHVICGQLAVVGKTLILDVRIAGASDTNFSAKARGKCTTTPGLEDLATQVIAELGVSASGGRNRDGDVFASRHAQRGELFELRGGDAKSRHALTAGLDWLARHQEPGGAWKVHGFPARCDVEQAADRCGGRGDEYQLTGVSALAVLALLADGNTPTKGKYADNVARGLVFLQEQQDKEGCFGSRHTYQYMYGHAIALSALAEAYGMTRDPVLRAAAEKGVAFLVAAQNPELGWRYEVRSGDNDTSVTGWAVAALRTAALCGIPVDAAVFGGARAWVDQMTDASSGRVGYQEAGGLPARTQAMTELFPGDRSEALTAIGVMTRIFIGEDPRGSAPVEQGVALLMDRLPAWDPVNGMTDLYYWHWATLVLYEVGGERWETWNGALKTALFAGQAVDGARCDRGSWSTATPWGSEGGRVYTTAIACLTLSTYTRYEGSLRGERR